MRDREDRHFAQSRHFVAASIRRQISRGRTDRSQVIDVESSQQQQSLGQRTEQKCHVPLFSIQSKSREPQPAGSSPIPNSGKSSWKLLAKSDVSYIPEIHSRICCRAVDAEILETPLAWYAALRTSALRVTKHWATYGE